MQQHVVATVAMGVQVNYVGKAANLYEDAGYELHGAAYVINNNLGMSHLWDRVRVMGGAYGGFCSFDSYSGMFQYLSYRCATPPHPTPHSCAMRHMHACAFVSWTPRPRSGA